MEIKKFIAALLFTAAQAVSGSSATAETAKANSASQERQVLVVIATAKVKAGTADAFKKAVSTIVSETRKEKGNIVFVFHQSSQDPNEFAFYERWDSEGDLQRHLQAPHMQKFFTEVGAGFESGYPQIKQYQEVIY